MQKLTAIVGFIFLLLSSLVYSRPSACTRPDSTEIIYRGDGDELEEIYNALVTCPNITTLDLDFVWSGCLAPSELWVFQFKPEDRFPALRKLSLSDYDFEESWRHLPWYQHKLSLKEKITSSLKHLPQLLKNGFSGESDHPLWIEMPAPKESNLDKWLRAMNFSQIEDLHLAQEEKAFYERMRYELPNLKNLSLAWANSGTNVPQERIEFLRSVPPLESLSVSIGAPYYYDRNAKNRTRFPLDEILERHGSSLQSLTLKQSETKEANLRRPMLTVDEINKIGTLCPNLHHLCLDIDRDSSYGWPNATFDALTNMTSLESLTLRLEIGADLHDVNEPGAYGWNVQGLNGSMEWFRQPRMSLDVAEILFHTLRSKKVGNELTKVIFEVGDIADKPYSGPIYFASWEEGRARSFVCEMSQERVSNCTISDKIYPYGFDDLID